MEKNLKQLLTSVKNTPELGKLQPSVKASVFSRLMAEIETSSVPATQPTFMDMIRAPFHGIELREILQPVTALGVLVVVSVSWVGSVFASMNSVPGDSLYSLKLAAERAQLSFASTDDSRARLHVEFANRRADEVSKLLEDNSPNREAKLKEAMGNLKTEVQTVSEHLSNLQKGDEQTAVSLAKLVDRKVGGLELAMNTGLEGETDAVKKEATEVKDVVKIASAQALTVLIKDGGAKPDAAEALAKRVEARVAELKEALAQTQKDFEAAQSAFAKRAARLPILSEADRKSAEAFKEMKSKLSDASDAMDEAETNLEAKEYGKALESVQSADDKRVMVKLELASMKSEPKEEDTIVPDSIPKT